MRTGKRTLAGVAAVGLGAALIPFVGAGVSQAATPPAAAIAFGVPSYSLVTDGWTAATAIPIPLVAVDAAGEQLAGGDAIGPNRSIEITVINPGTVDPAADVTAPSAASFNAASTGANLAALTFDPGASVGGGGNWSDVSAAQRGTYTLRARLINTTNGNVLSNVTVPVTITSAAGATAPTVTPHNSVLNPISSLGAFQGAATGDLYWSLTNSTGGPFLTALNGQTLSAASAQGATWNNAAPLGGAFGTTGVYRTTTNGSTWSGTRTSDTVTATLTTGATPVATRALPVSLSTINGAGVTIDLTSEPQGLGVDAVVPTGTTSFSFDLQYGNATAGTLYWNAQVQVAGPGNAPSAVVTPSGGIVATNAQGSATLDITVNAAAARVGNILTLNVDGDTFVITFQNPTANLVANDGLGKVGTAATLTGSITDQFDRPISGTWTITLRPNGIACNNAAAPLATTTAAADGSFALTVPAASAPAVPGTVDFDVCATLGAGTFVDSPQTATMTYTASGGVNSLEIDTDVPGTPAATPVVSAPRTGFVALGGASTTNAVANPASANPNAMGTQSKFEITPVSSPATLITVTVPEGAYISTRTAGNVAWSSGAQSITVPSGTDLSVWSTAPGLHTITATAGSTTDTQQFAAGVVFDAGRVLTIAEPTKTVGVLEAFTLSASVTDIYGNAVPGAGVTTASSGAVSGGTTVNTGSDGMVTMFFTSGQVTGGGVVSWTLNDFVASGAAISGSPALVRTGQTLVTVGGSTTPAIMIEGTRGTGDENNRIYVAGETTGFEMGALVVPFFRFPGQTGFTEGTARPEVDQFGDFTWTRKTGKQIDVRITSLDGEVVSNRIRIDGR